MRVHLYDSEMPDHCLGISPATIITDPALLGPHFDGASWATWRAVLKAAYGEPLTIAELERFRSVAGDRERPCRQVRELWVIAGRRAGKDSIASAIATAAAVGDHRRHLRPGERAVVMCLAVNRDQARIVSRYIQGYFSENPLLRPLVMRQTDDGLELRNGVDIIVSTNSYRAVRGKTLLCVIFDEVAFWRDEDSAYPDAETYHAVMPGLVTLPGSLLVGITTVYRRSGLAYEKWRKHYGQSDNDVLCVYGPSTAFNPKLPQRIIDDALARDPEAAAAEWLSQWRSDLSDFLDRELIAAATDQGVIARPPQPTTQYAAFTDPSGGRGDSFTLAIAHGEDNSVVLDCLFEKRAPFDPSTVVSDIAVLLRAYAVSEVDGDRYAAEWVVEAFAKEGIAYRQSERDRSAIYLDALPLFTAGRARLIDHQRLTHQLAGLTRRTSLTGRDRVDHPPGGADDLANSACGALVLAASDAVPALWHRSSLLSNGKTAEWPCLCQLCFASLAADDTGVAVLYWARRQDGLLLLVDYHVKKPFSPGLWIEIRDTLRQMATLGHAQIILFTSAALAAQARIFSEAEVLKAGNLAAARAAELPVEAVDALLADRDGLLLSCASEIGSGKVRLAIPAQARSMSAPLPLTGLRPGAPASAPIDAALIGVAAATVDLRSLPRAAAQHSPTRRSAGQSAAR